MKKIVYLIALSALSALIASSALTCSCDSKPATENFFEKEKQISGTIINADFLIGKNIKIVCIDSLLLLYDVYDRQTMSVCTKTGKLVRRFLGVGQGPGEVILPLEISVSEDNKLNVYQIQKSSLYEFDIKDIITEKNPVPRQYTFDDHPANVKRTANSFVGIGPYPGGRYKLYNESGKTLNTIGKYPFRGEKMNAMERFFIYQGILCSSPDGNYFSLASSYCDNLEFYRIERENALLIKKYETHDVLGAFDNNILKIDGDCIMNYKGAYGTEQYYYALYSGKKYGDPKDRRGGKKIIMFDWKGNYIKTFTTDKTIHSFCIDKTNQTLFAIVNEEEEGYVIMSFNFRTPDLVLHI
jgi:hypothetical protein